MLTNLVKRVVALDNERLDKRLLVEGAILQSNMPTIKRYSLMEGCCHEAEVSGNTFDVDSLATVLGTVKFTDTDTEEDKKEKLYNIALKMKPLNEFNEAATFDNTDKDHPIIKITEEDFNTIREAFMNIKKDPTDKESVKICYKFASEVARMLNKVKTDDNPFDPFINSLVDIMFKQYNGGTSKMPEKFENSTEHEKLVFKLSKITLNTVR